MFINYVLVLVFIVKLIIKAKQRILIRKTYRCIRQAFFADLGYPFGPTMHLFRCLDEMPLFLNALTVYYKAPAGIIAFCHCFQDQGFSFFPISQPLVFIKIVAMR